jgi:hypothetical protein
LSPTEESDWRPQHANRAGSIFRFPITQTNLFGDATQTVNLQSLPGGAIIQPGDTRFFQFWFRDIPGGGSGTNLSNTLRVQFCP